ncbi:MAG: hypothetical protein AAGA93_01055 [Actinomycetota bacterium]
MSSGDQTESSDGRDGRDGLWSGAAVSPGPSELAPALVPSFLVIAVPVVLVGLVFGVLLPGIPWWFGVLLGLLAAVGAVWWLADRADQFVLRSLGPVVPESRHPIRLTNMVDGLTLAGGVITPSVLVVDDPAANAMAIRRKDRNHLLFTTGLVDALDVVELEAAVAELLTRLRNGDAETATIGASLLGRPLIDGPLGSLLGPVGHRTIARLLPPDRDLEADRQAVGLTRYPPGLIKALGRLQGRDLAPAAGTAGTAHLWLADPQAGATSNGDDRRAPLGLRIDALAEL